MKLKKVVIIGTGLIGGSIGKALLEKKLAGEVVGLCRRQSTLDRTLKEKAVTKGFVNNYKEACEGAEMVFIATPVHTIAKALEELSKVLSPEVVVTDAGSTKKRIVDHAARFKNKFSFVGSHPLAGSERAGVEFAKGDLFEGSLCVVTRGEFTREEDLLKVQDIWKAMGAGTDVLTPEKHDEALAFTSHLPHVLAFSLTGIQKEEYFKYMASGFKDTTRIASSDPGLWTDILMSNRENVIFSMQKFKDVLADIEKDIRAGNEEALRKKLELYRKTRDGIS